MKEAAAQQAWGHVAAGTVLLMVPLEAMTGKRMRAIRRGFHPGMEENGETMERLRDPFLKVSLGVRVTVFLATFLLVSTKPGTLPAVEMIAAAILLGLLMSKLPWRRRAVAFAVRASVGK